MTLASVSHTVSISVPLTSVKSALEHLLNLQTGVALAIATLGQVGAFDASTVLDGVADIFLAIAAMSVSVVDTTVVFDGAASCLASTTQLQQ